MICSKRQPVAENAAALRTFNVDLRRRPPKLMLDRCRACRNELREFDALGRGIPPPFAGQLQDGVDQSVHLFCRRTDEADRLRHVLRRRRPRGLQQWVLGLARPLLAGR